MNLLTCPTYKIEDRKTILDRVLDALLADPDCRYMFKGEWKHPTVDQLANWEARQLLVQIRGTFPANVPPPAEVESPDADSID